MKINSDIVYFSFIWLLPLFQSIVDSAVKHYQANVSRL